MTPISCRGETVETVWDAEGSCVGDGDGCCKGDQGKQEEVKGHENGVAPHLEKGFVGWQLSGPPFCRY